MSIVPYSHSASNNNFAGAINNETHEENTTYYVWDLSSSEEEEEQYFCGPWAVAMNTMWDHLNHIPEGAVQQRVIVNSLQGALPCLGCGDKIPFDTEFKVTTAQTALLCYLQSLTDVDVVLCFPATDGEEERTIPCHRWVLSCHSQYYNTFFSGQWFTSTLEADDDDKKPRRVVVEDGRYEHVRQLVEYCYGGDFPCYHSAQSGADTRHDLCLLQMVHRLVIPGLLVDVVRHIEEYHLKQSSMCEVLLVATTLGLTALKEKSMSRAGEMLHRHLRLHGMTRPDCTFEEVCGSARQLFPRFDELPAPMQASLFMLQRTFQRYQQSFGTAVPDPQSQSEGASAISAREIISILAECLEEDTERYQLAWERLQVEILAYLAKLQRMRSQSMFGELFVELSNVTTYTSVDDTTLNVNTNSIRGPFAYVFGGGDSGGIPADMLAWRDRIVKVDGSLTRQRTLIDMQKEFYIEQRNALRAGEQECPLEEEADWVENEVDGVEG